MTDYLHPEWVRLQAEAWGLSPKPSLCPNCARPFETHEMFNPPRCPVVRLRFPTAATEPTGEMVPYSRFSDGGCAATEKVSADTKTQSLRHDGEPG